MHVVFVSQCVCGVGFSVKPNTSYAGLDKIEALQQHENMEIYKLAFDIVDKHFQSTVRSVYVCIIQADEYGAHWTGL